MIKLDSLKLVGLHKYEVAENVNSVNYTFRNEDTDSTVELTIGYATDLTPIIPWGTGLVLGSEYDVELDFMKLNDVVGVTSDNVVGHTYMTVKSLESHECDELTINTVINVSDGEGTHGVIVMPYCDEVISVEPNLHICEITIKNKD